jgi:hypothetical protein
VTGAAWVAGSVRARLLAAHCLGVDGAREVAMTGSVDAARSRLRASAYEGTVAGSGSVADTQHALWATVIWDLRVLAGWLPGAGVSVVRVFAGWFEIENIDRRLALLSGGDEPPRFELGGLGTVWSRVRDAGSAQQVREQLRTSPWRDPGSDDRIRILQALRLEWAHRLSEIDAARSWGAGAAALVIARALVEQGEPVVEDLGGRARVLGRRPLEATTFADFVGALPDVAQSLFDGVDADDVWRAEAAWWRRLDHDGDRLLRAARSGPAVVVGAVARRMADAWRTCAALEVASRGAGAEELVDVIA